MIDANGVGKTFGTQRVLESINLHVARGEFVSLVGPSGCGKSTLLRMVSGLEKPDQGQILIDGQQATLREETAFVFQHPNLLHWRNVNQNVGLPLELRQVPRADRRAKVRTALNLVGLDERDASKYPRQLSGGMQMRVSLARALVTTPKMILLDEPFAALDDVLRQQLNEELLRLWEAQQWATLFVTHHVSEAVFLSQRIMVMGREPGRIVEEIAVPFSFPREQGLRGTSEFAQLTNRVSQKLREVVS